MKAENKVFMNNVLRRILETKPDETGEWMKLSVFYSDYEI